MDSKRKPCLISNILDAFDASTIEFLATFESMSCGITMNFYSFFLSDCLTILFKLRYASKYFGFQNQTQNEKWLKCSMFFHMWSCKHMDFSIHKFTQAVTSHVYRGLRRALHETACQRMRSCTCHSIMQCISEAFEADVLLHLPPVLSIPRVFHTGMNKS